MLRNHGNHRYHGSRYPGDNRGIHFRFDTLYRHGYSLRSQYSGLSLPDTRFMINMLACDIRVCLLQNREPDHSRAEISTRRDYLRVNGLIRDRFSRCHQEPQISAHTTAAPRESADDWKTLT